MNLKQRRVSKPSKFELKFRRKPKKPSSEAGNRDSKKQTSTSTNPEYATKAQLATILQSKQAHKHFTNRAKR